MAERGQDRLICYSFFATVFQSWHYYSYFSINGSNSKQAKCDCRSCRQIQATFKLASLGTDCTVAVAAQSSQQATKAYINTLLVSLHCSLISSPKLASLKIARGCSAWAAILPLTAVQSVVNWVENLQCIYVDKHRKRFTFESPVKPCERDDIKSPDFLETSEQENIKI